MPNNQRLRTPDAAIYVGTAQSTLEKLRTLGRGPAYIKLGRAVIYDTADLDAWLHANRCPPKGGNKV